MDTCSAAHLTIPYLPCLPNEHATGDSVAHPRWLDAHLAVAAPAQHRVHHGLNVSLHMVNACHVGVAHARAATCSARPYIELRGAVPPILLRQLLPNANVTQRRECKSVNIEAKCPAARGPTMTTAGRCRPCSSDCSSRCPV